MVQIAEQITNVKMSGILNIFSFHIRKYKTTEHIGIRKRTSNNLKHLNFFNFVKRVKYNRIVSLTARATYNIF